MGTHPIFESDFDCLTEVIGEAKTAKMSEQIPVEFEEEVEEIDPFDMICGDDISRLPEVVNPNEKKPEKIEETEEKPSYAAVARSRPTSECNDNELVEDPVVEDIVEEPVKQAAPEPSVSATPKVEAVPEAETEGKQSRAERKTKKAMMKLGLAPVEGINRVVLRKDKTLLFVVPNPEVFRKGDTWVVLGEARVEDPNQRAREMAAAKVAENIQPKTKTEPVQATITEEDEETDDVPADGVEEKDIELVMQQAACTRAKAISALKSNSNDIVNAIMELTL